MELPFLSPSPHARRVRREGQKNLVLATRFLFAPELCQATARKPPRKNKRGAERRQAPYALLTAPRAQTLPPEPASGAARATRLRRYRRNALRARSPLGAPPRHSPRLLPLGSASARVSWNRRVQTGGPSPTPVQ